MKKWFCGVLALGLVAALAVPARAAQTGSIQVTLQDGSSCAQDGSLKLYHVAYEADGNFWLREELGGGFIHRDDALSTTLAKWLTEMVGEDGMEQPLDSQGCASFDNLEAGLYLLVQSELSQGFHRMEPMTVTIPCQQQWKVRAYPKISEILWNVPATGQSPLPFFGMAGMVLSALGLMGCCYVAGSWKEKTIHN